MLFVVPVLLICNGQRSKLFPRLRCVPARLPLPASASFGASCALFYFFIFIFFRFGKPPNPKYVARAKRKEGSSGDRRQTWPPPPQYSVSPLKKGWESLFPRTGGRPLARGTRHAPPFHGGVPMTENSVGPASVPSNGVFIRPLGQGGILAQGLREGVQV